MWRPLLRRIVAWIIDLVVIGVPSAVIAFTQAERFVSTRTGDGGLVVGAAQSARLAELDDVLALRWTQGQNLHVWAGPGLFVTVAAFVCLAVIVLALVPANLEGATPGMRQMRLRVATVDGAPPRLGTHLVRTAVGLVDLAPYVVPGLVGLGFALGPNGRRLGDRVAGTVVVDARYPAHPRRPVPDRTAVRVPAPAGGHDGRHDRDRPRLTDVSDVPVGWATTASRWTGETVDTELAPTTASTIAPVGRATVDRTGVIPPVPRRLRRTADPPSPRAARPVPAWDDDLGAWVVTHPQTGARYRHDPDAGRWEPLDDGRHRA